MRHFDTDALATFIAVMDHGGFTAAAERLGKTQAAVSLIVSRLEERLGKRLVQRSRKGVTLTSQGEILMGYARRMLVLEDEALCALECTRDAGRVRIGMPDDYLDTLGAWLLQSFSVRHPEIQVEILCDFSKRLEPQVHAGDIDLAIITRDAGRPVGELLCSEAQVWCGVVGGRPEREQVLPLALFADACRARPGILAALDGVGRPWRIASSSSHLPGVLAAVRLGTAVTVLPASVVPGGWRRMGVPEGLPLLPELELALLVPQGARLATRRLANFIRDLYLEKCQGALA
ncbi:MAG: LysR substrate-binding domain-containing protein [Comamonas sp.]